jgi:hypothetical protein
MNPQVVGICGIFASMDRNVHFDGLRNDANLNTGSDGYGEKEKYV